jgi:hypothetical protein
MQEGNIEVELMNMWYTIGKILALITIIELVLLTNNFVDSTIKNYQRHNASVALLEIIEEEF